MKKYTTQDWTDSNLTGFLEKNIKQGYFGGYDSSQVRNVNRDPDTEYATQLSICIDNDMMVLDTTLIS